MTLSRAEAIFLALADVDAGDRARVPRRALRRRCVPSDATSRRWSPTLDAPDEEFLDPERHSDARHGGGRRTAAARHAPRRLSRPPRARLGRHGRRLRGAAGSSAPNGRDQGAPARAIAIPRFSGGSSTRPRCSADCSIRASRRCTRFIRATAPIPAHLVMELVAGPPLTDYARAEQLSIAGARRAHRQARRRSAARARARRHPSRSQAGQRARRRQAASRRCSTSASRARPAPTYSADHDADRARAVDGHARLHEPRTTARASATRSTRRSDVYALGVLLYRLLADRLPFDVVDLSLARGDPARPREPIRCRSARGRIQRSRSRSNEIVARAMSREVAARYQTAADLAADLLRFLEGRGTAAPERLTRPSRVDRADPIAMTVPRRETSLEWPPPLKGVRALAASHDRTTRCCGPRLGIDRAARRRQPARRSTRSMRGHGAVVALTFAADGRLVAAWDDGTVATSGVRATLLKPNRSSKSRASTRPRRLACRLFHRRGEEAVDGCPRFAHLRA